MSLSAPDAGPRQERILHVEDNDINRELFRTQLEFLGFEADFVTDAARAITAVRNVTYDVIFMDCQLPVMDGLAATRIIRGAELPSARVPIIAVTANVMPGYREACLAAGMDDYLPKPILLDPLAAMLARWLPDAENVDSPTQMDLAMLSEPSERFAALLNGNAGGVQELLTIAARSLRTESARLSSAIDGRDTNMATRAAHTLKGAALELGHNELTVCTETAEAAAAAGNWPAAHAAASSASGIVRAFIRATRAAGRRV